MSAAPNVITGEDLPRILDALPDETLIEASGTYASDAGSFYQCWARPVPRYVTGDGPRTWEVLVFGDSWPQNLVTTDRITAARVLYTTGRLS